MKKLKLEELGRLSIEEFHSIQKIPLVLLLDNIRSGMNVGSFFRSADAFACEEIILTGISPYPPHKEINKTAIGADSSVKWKYVEDAIGELERRKKQGYSIVSVEQTTDSVGLNELSKANISKLLLVFGNEVDGVSDEIIQASDYCLEIDQFGTKHSLNVAVCGGIVLHHFSRLFRS